MSLDYALANAGLALGTLAADGRANWCVPMPDGAAVAVVVDGRPVTGLVVSDRATTGSAGGGYEDMIRCRSGVLPGLEVDWHVRRYPDLAIVESWVAVHNATPAAVTVERLDSVVVQVDTADCELLSFTSGWGLEFEGVSEPLCGAHCLQSLSGRSSQGQHPYFALVRPDGAALVGSVAWSGNWVVRLDPREDGGHTLSAGLHDEGFAARLQPGERMEAPHVVLAVGDLDSAAVHLGQAARRHWAPRNALAERLPVE